MRVFNQNASARIANAAADDASALFFDDFVGALTELAVMRYPSQPQDVATCYLLAMHIFKMPYDAMTRSSVAGPLRPVATLPSNSTSAGLTAAASPTVAAASAAQTTASPTPGARTSFTTPSSAAAAAPSPQTVARTPLSLTPPPRWQFDDFVDAEAAREAAAADARLAAETAAALAELAEFQVRPTGGAIESIIADAQEVNAASLRAVELSRAQAGVGASPGGGGAGSLSAGVSPAAQVPLIPRRRAPPPPLTPPTAIGGVGGVLTPSGLSQVGAARTTPLLSESAASAAARPFHDQGSSPTAPSFAATSSAGSADPRSTSMSEAVGAVAGGAAASASARSPMTTAQSPTTLAHSPGTAATLSPTSPSSASPRAQGGAGTPTPVRRQKTAAADVSQLVTAIRESLQVPDPRLSPADRAVAWLRIFAVLLLMCSALLLFIALLSGANSCAEVSAAYRTHGFSLVRAIVDIEENGCFLLLGQNTTLCVNSCAMGALLERL